MNQDTDSASDTDESQEDAFKNLIKCYFGNSSNRMNFSQFSDDGFNLLIEMAKRDDPDEIIVKEAHSRNSIGPVNRFKSVDIAEGNKHTLQKSKSHAFMLRNNSVSKKAVTFNDGQFVQNDTFSQNYFENSNFPNKDIEINDKRPSQSNINPNNLFIDKEYRDKLNLIKTACTPRSVHRNCKPSKNRFNMTGYSTYRSNVQSKILKPHIPKNRLFSPGFNRSTHSNFMPSDLPN